tara:strand:- start:282 stop:425 length:144 start_codon:yes stop_codon:yes gene_type:complete
VEEEEEEMVVVVVVEGVRRRLLPVRLRTRLWRRANTARERCGWRVNV